MVYVSHPADRSNQGLGLPNPASFASPAVERTKFTPTNDAALSRNTAAGSAATTMKRAGNIEPDTVQHQLLVVQRDTSSARSLPP